MDAINLLISDHREVEALFKKFEELSDGEPGRQAFLAEKICKALQVHMTIEEELFYPAAREVFDDDDDGMVDEGVKEHAEAKELIEKIMSLTTGPELDKAMEKLKEAIEHHVSDEEDEMFPALQDQGMETIKLGAELEARKYQLMALSK